MSKKSDDELRACYESLGQVRAAVKSGQLTIAEVTEVASYCEALEAVVVHVLHPDTTTPSPNEEA